MPSPSARGSPWRTPRAGGSCARCARAAATSRRATSARSSGSAARREPSPSRCGWAASAGAGRASRWIATSTLALDRGARRRAVEEARREAPFPAPGPSRPIVSRCPCLRSGPAHGPPGRRRLQRLAVASPRIGGGRRPRRGPTVARRALPLPGRARGLRHAEAVRRGEDPGKRPLPRRTGERGAHRAPGRAGRAAEGGAGPRGARSGPPPGALVPGRPSPAARRGRDHRASLSPDPPGPRDVPGPGPRLALLWPRAARAARGLPRDHGRRAPHHRDRRRAGGGARGHRGALRHRGPGQGRLAGRAAGGLAAAVAARRGGLASGRVDGRQPSSQPGPGPPVRRGHPGRLRGGGFLPPAPRHRLRLLGRPDGRGARPRLERPPRRLGRGRRRRRPRRHLRRAAVRVSQPPLPGPG